MSNVESNHHNQNLMSSEFPQTHQYDICPRCGCPTVQATSYSGQPSEFWYRCSKCPTFINTYQPMDHQRAVHEDHHRIMGNFGGYGTGKTTTTRQEIYKHIFITPKANVLVGAKVTSQYEQTIKREIEADIPQEFVHSYNDRKQIMDFINGARIMYRPLDDPDKLRSYNLSMWVIIEGSEVTQEAYAQLKTRLRNKSAIRTGLKSKADWRKGIVESNPDSGWVRTEILLTSETIYKHGRILDDYVVLAHAMDQYISSHVASTSVNIYLPENFVDELVKNKPLWWVSRYIYGSFSYSEGLVYPSAMRVVIPQRDIPVHWPTILACDYGLSDNFTYVKGRIDPDKGMLYIIDEFVTSNKNIDELAKSFFEFTKEVPIGCWYTQPILDPKSMSKRDYEKKDLGTHFAEKGIYFKPGHIQIAARVMRLNTYIESGRLWIMDNCTHLIQELEKYKFPTKSLDGSTRAADKPIDKNNHCINPLTKLAA